MLDKTWNLIRYDFQMMSLVYYDALYFFSSVGDQLSYFHTWACFEIFGWHMLFFAFNLKFFFFAISPPDERTFAPDFQFFREVFFPSFFYSPQKCLEVREKSFIMDTIFASLKIKVKKCNFRIFRLKNQWSGRNRTAII